MIRNSSFGTVPRLDSTLKVNQNGLRRWMVSICVIRFDLEQGQLMEECFPPGCISQQEESDVAFTSFPDSMATANNRASIHDCFFFFRIRRRGTPLNPGQVVSKRASRNGEARRRTSTSEEDQRVVSSASSMPRSPAPNAGSVGQKALLSVISDTALLASPRTFLHKRAVTADAAVLKEAAGCSPDSSGRERRVTDSDAFRGSHLNPGHIDSPHPRRNSFQDDFQKLSLSPSSSSNSIAVGSPKVSGPGSGCPRYLYGFVFNRQRQDERLKRGGEQKSLVILSEKPLLGVFRPLVQIAGPMFFDNGPEALEQIAAYVSMWPAPQYGQSMELPISAMTLRVHLPPLASLPPGAALNFAEDQPSVPPLTAGKLVPQGVFHESDMFNSLRGLLLDLWTIWELMVTGEPLLLIAPTPSQCSEAVAALLSLIAPLPCSLDFRPYFTIHDPDFAHLNSIKEGEPPPAMILGVTNLFFLKTLKALPNVLSVGTPLGGRSQRSVGPASLVKDSSARSSPSRFGAVTAINLSPLKRAAGTLLRVAQNRGRTQGPLSLMTEHKEALWSSYTPTIKPDTSVLNRLVDGGTSPRAEEGLSLVNNDVLRRHFVELTTNFLAPFGPYLRGSTPPTGSSPFAEPPPLCPFHAHEFLDGLAARGPGKFLQKRLRNNWLELYKRFLVGPNFMPWFQRRRAAAEAEQHRHWRKARSEAEVKTFLQSMSEVEIVDAFNAVEKHLVSELHAQQRVGNGVPDSALLSKLRCDLRHLYNALPRDVQQMLMFNPQRAALLQGGREVRARMPGRISLNREMSSDLNRAPSPEMSFREEGEPDSRT